MRPDTAAGVHEGPAARGSAEALHSALHGKALNLTEFISGKFGQIMGPPQNINFAGRTPWQRR